MSKQKTVLTLDEAKIVHKRFLIIAGVSLIVILIGVLSMMHLEGWGVVDSIYFSVVSLTTVGYGDLTPTTDGGKIFVVFYLLVGIAIIASLINNILKGLVARRVIHNSNEKNE